MDFTEVIDTILRKKNVRTANFRVHPDNVIHNPAANDAEHFTREETYFEIRLSQMYLRDGREYWREFLPLASILTEFQFNGKRRVVPTVVGPDLLKEAAQVKGSDPVEYVNTRVAGPYPYEGDDLTLFVGLFRMVTTNWAARTLSLLESVAKVFDSTKLSSAISVADPLVEGVEGLLGMNEVEMRMGRREAYETASEEAETDASDGLLVPAYEVLLNRPEVDDEERRRFSVEGGKLYFADRAGRGPYDKTDFVLYRLQPLTRRDDYTTFEFHTVYWKKVENHIWENREAEARKAFQLLAVNLVECPDIVRPHRISLLRKYKQQLDDDLAEAKALFATGAPPAFRDDAGPGQLKETDLRRALDSVGPRGQAQDLEPETILAEVGL